MLHTQNLAAVSKVPRSTARIKKEEGNMVEYAYLKAGLDGLNRESGQQKLPNEGEDKSNTSCDWSSNKSTEAADLDPEDFNTHLRAMQKKFHAKEAELELALSRLKSREAELECAMHDRDKAEARAAAYNAELSEVRKQQIVVPIGSALPDSQEASSAPSAYARPECKTEEGSRLPTQYGHIELSEDMLHSISRREHASLMSCITEVNLLRDSTRGLTAHAVASLGGKLDANDGNRSGVHKLADVETEGHRLEGTARTPLSPCWTVPEQEVLSRQASSTTTFAATVSTRGPDWTGGSSSADPAAQPAYSSAPSTPREKPEEGLSPSVPAASPWEPRRNSPLSGALSLSAIPASNDLLIDMGSAMGSAQSALSSGHGSATPAGQPRGTRDSLLHHPSAPNFRLPGRRLGSSADVHAARTTMLGTRTKEDVSLSPRTSPTRSFRVVQPFASPTMCSRSISVSRDQSPSLRFSLLSTLPGQTAPNLQTVPPEMSTQQLPGATAQSMQQEAVLAAVSPLQAGQQRSPRPSLSPPAETRALHMPAKIIDQARKLSPIPVQQPQSCRSSAGNKEGINANTATAALLASPTLLSRGVASCTSLALAVDYGLRQRSPRGVEVQKVSPAAWQAQSQVLPCQLAQRSPIKDARPDARYQVSPLERMSPRTCRPPDTQNQHLQQQLDQHVQVPDASPLSPESQKDTHILFSQTRASESTPTWRPPHAAPVDEVVLGTSTPITRRSPPCSPNITSRESQIRTPTLVGFRAGSNLTKRTV